MQESTALENAPDTGAVLADECLDRARALVPLLREAAPRIEVGRELPADVLQAMHDAELFRLTLPRELGGAEIHPRRLAQVTEAVATGHARRRAHAAARVASHGVAATRAPGRVLVAAAGQGRVAVGVAAAGEKGGAGAPGHGVGASVGDVAGHRAE